jgi:hypothetical protein
MKPLISRSGAVLGYLHDVSPYRKEIRTRSNSLLGWYNPQLNKTFDATGRVIANDGDIRAHLLSQVR